MPVSVIVSAGKGLRMNAPVKKQFIPLCGRPLIVHTLSRFLDANLDMDKVVLAAPAEDIQYCRNEIFKHVDSLKSVELTQGGSTRQESVLNGLVCAANFLASEKDIVLIHDGVRPFVSLEIIKRVVDAARKTGGAIPAVPATDTLKRVKKGIVQSTVDRAEIFMAQTPQAFQYDLIRNAHEHAKEKGIAATDDASLFEAVGLPVAIVPGDRKNIKITTREDLLFAQVLLENNR